MNGFKRQLDELEGRMCGLSGDYPTLSAEEQRGCMERLDETIKSLTGIRSSLKEVMVPDESKKVVQVTCATQCKLDFHQIFYGFRNAMSGGNSTMARYMPVDFSVETEENYKVGSDHGLQKVLEYFVCFQSDKDACYALGLEQMRLNNGQSVGFVQPSRGASERAMWRRIGALVERIAAIDVEIKKMGVDHTGGQLNSLGPRFLDRTYFPQWVPAWKRTRLAGASLDHNAYGALMRQPVDATTIAARFKALYDEKCDALIELREHQLNGLEFVF
jgi:hypothetical protein